MLISFGRTINDGINRGEISIPAALIIRKYGCTVKSCNFCSYDSIVTLNIATGDLIIKSFVNLIDKS